MKTRFTLLTVLIALFAISAQSQTARVQAIHNCPDPAAATVDLWINDQLLIDDFSYKAASPYIDAPAGSSFDLSICTPGSTDTIGAIFKKSFLLDENMTYTVVAGGGLNETGATAFDLRAYIGQEQASNQGANEVSLNIIHGAYDAPVVDIYEVQIPAGELVPDLGFGEDIGSYVNLPATDFDIQIRTQAGIAAAEFDVNVTDFADNAITVLATGFLDPENAVGDEPFGLIAAFPDGLVAQLPGKSITPARLQVIHNSAATDAGSVDIWLNDAPLLNDFMFRTASPFIDAPAGTYFDVSVALPGSTDTVNALFRQTFLLESSKTYIVIASGTVGSGMYSPNTPFTLEVIAEAKEMSSTSGNVDVLVWHGATDAPTVDVVETLVGAGTIVDNLSYGEYQGYLDLPATAFILDIRDETGTQTVASYAADISSLQDQAITIIASGFLSPAANNNGPAFGLWVALPSGGELLELGNVTSVGESSMFDAMRVFPNPSSNNFYLTLQSESSTTINYQITDLMGKKYIFGNERLQEGNNQLVFDAENLSPGFYNLTLFNFSGQTSAFKLIKQ